MKADYVNPFLISFLDVMNTMGQVAVTHGAPSKKTGEVAKGDVSGIVGMVGPQARGSMAITLQKSLVLELYANMLSERVDEIDAEVIDLVGEITNMVCGGAKRELGKRGYEFELATPSMVSGASHTVHHKVDGAKLIMPFNSEYGMAYVEICFEE